ncbi:MAG: hypothetical protein ACRDWD_03135 [Acidimicrobiia bacterium]
MLARYVLGILLAVVALFPIGLGARATRAWLLPGWSGAPAVLAEVVLGLGLVIGVSEIFGAVGLFRVVPMVAGLAATGWCVWLVARRRSSTAPVSAGNAPLRAGDAAWARAGRTGLVVALVATSVVVAEWSTRTIAALRHGMEGVDTLWYHLPVAGRFAQEGSVTGVHFLEYEAFTAYFPANSAVLHALGILLIGTDLLSPLFNMGFLALVLLAAWCVGRPYGVAPVTLAGAALVLALPAIATTQPGGGYNDTVGVALLLASVAFLLNVDARDSWPQPAALGIAALGAGLALGTKWQFLAPVVALSFGVVAVAPRRVRRRTAALWLTVVGLAGGFWYARNLIAVGNPIPPLDLELGPISLPSISLGTPQLSVGEHLLDREVWQDYFLPGLGQAFGPASWALLALVACGLVLGVVAPRSGMHCMLALVGIVTLGAYVVTPSALGSPGEPVFFVYTLRYAVFGIMLSVVLLPLTPLLSGGRAWLPLAAIGVVLAATQLDPSIWPTELRAGRIEEPIRGVEPVIGVAVGVAVVVTGLAVLAVRAHQPGWQPTRAVIAALTFAVLAGGVAFQETYLRNRYADTELPLAAIYAWARDVSDERIAVVGNWLQYPLYGNDLSNHVQFVGARGPHGSYTRITDCASWRRALNEGHYTYVVTAPNLAVPNLEPAERAWTERDPAAELVMRDGKASLFRLDGRLDPTTCGTNSADR